MTKNYEGRKENGEGNVRKLPSGKYECVVQSKFLMNTTRKEKMISKIVKKYSRQKTFRNFIMPTKIIWDSIRLLYYFYWKQGLESENLPYGSYMEIRQYIFKNPGL